MVKIFKNFLTKEECKILSDIAFQGIEEKWIGPGISQGKFGYQKRLTSRMHMNITNKKYPDFVIEVSKKIRKFMKISDYPLIKPHGSDGVVVSVTFDGGDVYEHQDPRSEKNELCYRCNVMTQASDEGGILYVDNRPIDINVGDLHCYYASEHPHYVTEVKGSVPRIMWMFGAYRPQEDFVKTLDI